MHKLTYRENHGLSRWHKWIAARVYRKLDYNTLSYAPMNSPARVQNIPCVQKACFSSSVSFRKHDVETRREYNYWIKIINIYNIIRKKKNYIQVSAYRLNTNKNNFLNL